MKQDKNKKLWTVLIVVAVVLIVSGGLVYFRHNQNQQNTYQAELKKKDEAQKQAEKNPQSESDWRKAQEESNSSAANNTTLGSKQKVAPVVTTLDQNTSSVTVRAFSPSMSGNNQVCSVKFSKSGQEDVTQNTGIGLQGSYYVCQGFDIPKSTFPIKGEWRMTFNVSSSTVEGSTAPQMIIIN